MKKLILLFTLGAVASTNAQVIIDQVDFPEPGDSVIFGNDVAIDASLNVSIGGVGAGQTFDFSMLQTDEVVTVKFYDPATVPGGTDFPTSALAMDQSGAFAHAEITSGEVNIIGLSGDFAEQLGIPEPGEFVTSIPALDPWTIFKFPSQLGTTFTDEAHFRKSVDTADLDLGNFSIADAWNPAPDSVRLVRRITIESEIDAEGILTDVYGNAHEVLRMRVREVSTDSLHGRNSSTGLWENPPLVVAFALGLPSTETIHRVRYVSKDAGFYIVELLTNAAGTPLSATFVSDSTQIIGIEEVIARGENVIYPNPANSIIKVRTGGDSYVFEILDLSGKLVASHALRNDNQTVDIDALPSGLYVYRMISTDGLTAHSGRLSVVK